jgi:hypothetical protein
MTRPGSLAASLELVLVTAGCGVIPAERVNTDCVWSGEASSPLDTQTRAGRRHLRNEATLAEELAIRYADRRRGFRSGHWVGNDEDVRSREQCLSMLVEIVARSRRVAPELVRDAVRQRPVLVDLAAVFLPMALLFALAGDLVARRVCRIFSRDQSLQRLLAIVAVSAFVTVLGYQLGSFWFWLAAFVRCRAWRSHPSEPRLPAATVDLGLRRSSCANGRAIGARHGRFVY